MASREKKQPERRDDSSKSEMMHRLKTRPFIFFGTIFILVIVVIAFVFVPAMVPQAGGVEGSTFGYYNRIPIRLVSGNFFHQVQQSLMREHQEQLAAHPNNLFLAHDIWRQAFMETVVHIAIQDEMRRAGFVVPNNVVDREMARQFQLPDGRFDRTAYHAMDSATRMARWRQVQESIAIGQYLSDLGSLRISSNEASFISSMASPRRTFSAAIFPISSYPDSEVISHAEANQSLFRITRLSSITVISERDAQQIRDMIQNGVTTFEEAARTNSLDPFAERGGDMGMRMAYELIPEIWNLQDRENVINLAQGDLSDVISVPLGWAFFRAEEASVPADTGDPFHLERIRSHIMTNLRGVVDDWVIAEAENFSAQVRERGFEEVAFEGNIMRRNFGPIPVNFGDSPLFSMVSMAGVPEIQHASRNLFFWEAAFSTPLMTPSQPIVLGDNVIVFFPLEESYLDEFALAPIESTYLSMVMRYLSFMFRNYFITNDKLDDRFNEAFWRHWRPN